MNSKSNSPAVIDKFSIIVSDFFKEIWVHN